MSQGENQVVWSGKSKAIIGIIVGIGVINLLFINATPFSGIEYNPQLGQCQGPYQGKTVNGIRVEGKVLGSQDCERFVGLSIANQNLQKNLVGSEMVQSQLSKVTLTNSHWQGVQMTSAQAKELSVENMRFEHVQLTEMDAVESQWKQNILLSTQLKNMNLSDSLWRDVKFNGVVSGLNATRLRLYDSQWNGVLVYGADLSFSQVINTKMDGLQLCGDLNFTEARFSQTSIQNMNVASQAGCQDSKVIFRNADLRGMNLSGMNQVPAIDFKESDLRGADLRAIRLSGSGMELQKAKYDLHTKFPLGFKPGASGMLLVGSNTISAQKSKTKKVK